MSSENRQLNKSQPINRNSFKSTSCEGPQACTDFTEREIVIGRVSWRRVIIQIRQHLSHATKHSIMDTKVEVNPYELLDIKVEATDQEIRTAYRQRSLKVHPDRVCHTLR